MDIVQEGVAYLRWRCSCETDSVELTKKAIFDWGIEMTLFPKGSVENNILRLKSLSVSRHVGSYARRLDSPI